MPLLVAEPHFTGPKLFTVLSYPYNQYKKEGRGSCRSSSSVPPYFRPCCGCWTTSALGFTRINNREISRCHTLFFLYVLYRGMEKALYGRHIFPSLCDLYQGLYRWSDFIQVRHVRLSRKVVEQCQFSVILIHNKHWFAINWIFHVSYKLLH